jgi:hypothetical protein
VLQNPINRKLDDSLVTIVVASEDEDGDEGHV